MSKLTTTLEVEKEKLRERFGTGLISLVTARQDDTSIFGEKDILDFLTASNLRILAVVEEMIGENVAPQFSMDSAFEYGIEMVRFIGINEEKQRMRTLIKDSLTPTQS